MKKILATLVITLAFVVPMGAVGVSTALAANPASHAAKVTASHASKVAAQSCPSYSTSCVIISPTINVSGKISNLCGVVNIGNVLTGNAQLNTSVQCAAIAQVVQTQCPAVSFSISGSGLNFRDEHGHLFEFNPNTGTSTAVAAITHSGIFSAVSSSCVGGVSVLPSVSISTLPITGGGQPAGPSAPYLPLGLGALLVLAGAAVAFRNRVTQV